MRGDENERLGEPDLEGSYVPSRSVCVGWTLVREPLFLLWGSGWICLCPPPRAFDSMSPACVAGDWNQGGSLVPDVSFFLLCYGIGNGLGGVGAR